MRDEKRDVPWGKQRGMLKVFALPFPPQTFLMLVRCALSVEAFPTCSSILFRLLSFESLKNLNLIWCPFECGESKRSIEAKVHLHIHYVEPEISFCCLFPSSSNASISSHKHSGVVERCRALLLFMVTSFYIANTIFADKPICRSEQKRIYGVARNEAAEILCEVDAVPPPESFKWSFNNTAETFEMPQSDYRIHSSQASTLSYTPVKVSFFSSECGWSDVLCYVGGWEMTMRPNIVFGLNGKRHQAETQGRQSLNT